MKQLRISLLGYLVTTQVYFDFRVSYFERFYRTVGCTEKIDRTWLGVQGISAGRDPFNQNSDRSDREKRTTSNGGPVFPELFRLERTDSLSFGPKFPEILVEWIVRTVFNLVLDMHVMVN